MLNDISSQCNKSFILSWSRQDPLMVDCYTDYYFSDNSEGTGTASLIIADHNILTTMSFIYTEREKTKLTKISMCQRWRVQQPWPITDLWHWPLLDLIWSLFCIIQKVWPCKVMFASMQIKRQTKTICLTVNFRGI